MEGRLLLEGCSIFRPDGRVRERMSIVIEGERVTRVAPQEDVPALPGDWVVACRDRLVTPSLTDCHTHLAGGVLLPVAGPALIRPRAWRRERASRAVETMSAGEAAAISAHALARGLLGGVTSFIDHLEATRSVSELLEAQAGAASALGARLVSSVALTSSSPPEAEEAAVTFALGQKAHPLVRGALGFHSSETIDDARLTRLGRAREELGLGVVFHLGEDEDDLSSTYDRSGSRIVARLESAGLLGPGVVGAIGSALDHADAQRLAKRRTLVALSPRLAQLESPQPSGLEALLAASTLVGLGTSGVGTLQAEIAAVYPALVTIARAGRLLDPDGQLAELLFNGPAELIGMLFGQSGGAVEEGRTADLIVHQNLALERDEGLLAGALLLHLASSRPAWVVASGKVVVREGVLLGADQLELEREAGRACAAIRQRLGSA